MAEDMNKSAAETEEEYQPDLMTLEDEDGNEVTFEVIDALDHKGVRPCREPRLPRRARQEPLLCPITVRPSLCWVFSFAPVLGELR